MKLDQALRLAKKKINEGAPEGAKLIYEDILARFPKNMRAIEGLKSLQLKPVKNNLEDRNPSTEALEAVIEFYNRGQLHSALSEIVVLLEKFPTSSALSNIHGVVLCGLGKHEDAIKAYKKSISIRPENADAFNNLGNAFADQNKFEDSVSAYLKALEIKPKYADAYNNMGVSLKAQGKLEAAAAAYGNAIKIAPSYHEAYTNLANTLRVQGNFEQAIELYTKVLTITPNKAKAYYNLGVALKEYGDEDGALEAYSQTLTMQADYHQAHTNTGVILQARGDFIEAVQAFEEAIKIMPNNADAICNMGVALKSQGRLQDAVECYTKAIVIGPDNVSAYYNMGIALREMGKFKEAIDALNTVISLDPNYADAYNNLGIIFQEEGLHKDAIKVFQKTLNIKPSFGDAYNNMGVCFKEQGKLEEALEAYGQALTVTPDNAEAYTNIGVIRAEQGNLDEAFEAYDKAISLKPDSADAYHNMSYVLLASKDFDAGFEYYDWRWQTDKFAADYLVTTKPRWDGEDKQRVLVWNEQGIGDEVMFSSIIPDLCKVSSKVIIRCDRRLIPLFKRSFPSDISYCSKDQVISEDDYDYHVPMGSLPLGLRKTLGSFAAMSPGFLKPDLDRASTFKSALLHGRNKKVVGLSWKTNSRLPKASTRNIKLADLALALHTDDTLLVCLQYGQVSDEIQAVKRELGIEIVQLDEVDNRTDLDGLASLMAACDEVVTVDNATTHLSGALGISTKLLLPTSPDWRWGTADDVSYWYDAVQLYRQSEPGNWQKVLARISAHTGPGL